MVLTNAIPKILGLIPARGGSKGIPGKNMKQLGAKPLISYTIESAQSSKMLDTIVVSSDCNRTIDYAKTFLKVEAPFRRPSNISDDHSPTIEVVQHALDYYASHGIDFEYVVLLQPTSPFRDFDLIDKSISHFLETGADSLITIQKIPDQFNPYWAIHQLDDMSLGFINADNGLITRRQELPDTYYRDGKIYIAHVSLIQKGLLLGGKTAGFITENERNINIDTYYDWQLAENELQKGSNIFQKEYPDPDHK